jgi:hypothetical protein
LANIKKVESGGGGVERLHNNNSYEVLAVSRIQELRKSRKVISSFALGNVHWFRLYFEHISIINSFNLDIRYVALYDISTLSFWPSKSSVAL